MSRRFLFLAVVCFTAQQLIATASNGQQPQNDSDDGLQQSAATYADIVRSDQPAAYWRFDDNKAVVEVNGSPLSSKQVMAGIQFSQPGPQRDKFPLFEKANRAAV